FWTTAKSKTVNEEVEIHALVDGMKVIITESSVMRDLQLADEDDKQLDGIPTHKEKYDVSFHTKKVFANIKRIGKGFSGKETPLFPTMVGPNQVQIGEGSAQSTNTQHTPTFDMPLPKAKKTQKPKQPKRKTTKVPQPKQDSGNIDKTKTKATSNEPSSQGTSLGDGPMRQDTIGDTSAHTRVISSSDDEALDKEDTSKQGRIDEIDADEDIALVSTHDDVNAQDNIFQDEGIEDVGEEEVVEVVTTAKIVIDVVVDATQVTTAIADISERSYDSRARGNNNNNNNKKIASSQQPQVQDKEKKKFFSEKRDEEKRNKPPTKAQQRSVMCTYLKNMDGWKIRSLKKKSFAKIKELFDKAMKRINTFIDFRTELVEESTKKMRQRQHKKAVQREKEINLNKKDLRSRRADGNSQMYLTFSKLLKNFDREDLKVLWRLFKVRFVKTKPVDHMDSFLLHTLKTMFEHHVEDNRIGKGFSGKKTPLFPTMVGPNQIQMGEGLTQPIDIQHTPTFDMPLPKPKKTQKPRQPKRKTTKVPQPSESTDIAADEAIHKEGAISNKPSSQRTSSSDGPRRQDTMGDTSAHTRYERVSKMSSDSLLAGVNTPRSDEDRQKHIELMKICTILQKKVLDLEDELKRIKTAQQTKINGLERRVKKLEKKHRSRTHKLKRLYKVGLNAKVISSSDDEALDKEDTSKQERIDEIDADKYIALVSTHDDVSTQDNIVQDKGIEDVGEEKVVEVVTNAKMIVDAAQVTTTIADILVSAAKTIVTTAPTITAESTKTNVKDKGKGKTKSIEEPEMPKKRKHQIRVAKELAEKIDADAQLDQRLHEEEQLQLTDAKKAKLFMEFIKKRRKFFTAKRDEEKRNKPPTKAQQMSILSIYLKNIDRWKIKSLKKKSFAEIQKLFDKAMKRINTFVDFKIELVEEISKKFEAEITQEDDGDDVNIDATPLSSKSPIIVDYKIYKEGKKNYF
nr:hypothetical protein [Tanacetum cinerariifolium]